MNIEQINQDYAFLSNIIVLIILSIPFILLYMSKKHSNNDILRNLLLKNNELLQYNQKIVVSNLPDNVLLFDLNKKQRMHLE
jgi:hypothetical protein